MKKNDLSELLDRVKSDPDEIDRGANQLAQGLSGAEERYPDDGADATMAEMKRACISLVTELKRRGQPPSEDVVEMLEWAVGLRRRKQGNPGKSIEREDAMMEEAAFQYRGIGGILPPISGRELAKRIGVSRVTVQKWRNDPDYLRGIKEYIEEDIETSLE